MEFIKEYDFGSCEGVYILEVDLSYPKGLHDGHNEFPLAPEAMCVKANMLPKYQRELYSTIYDKSPTGKTKYVRHIANLQLYVNVGLVLTSIHSVIKFKQSRWLKPIY